MTDNRWKMKGEGRKQEGFVHPLRNFVPRRPCLRGTGGYRVQSTDYRLQVKGDRWLVRGGRGISSYSMMFQIMVQWFYCLSAQFSHPLLCALTAPLFCPHRQRTFVLNDNRPLSSMTTHPRPQWGQKHSLRALHPGIACEHFSASVEVTNITQLTLRKM